MKYAITAATGKFGIAAVDALLKEVSANEIVAIVRDTTKAKEVLPDGIEIREGNYDDKESMVNAFAGIDKVLFISSQPGGKVARDIQHQNVVDALVQDNVDFVAYTSFPDAQNSVSQLAGDHKATEDAIKKAGIKHAFLRNNWYLENEIGFIQSGVANQTASYWASNTVGWALEREYATAAVKVLVGDNTKDVYEFSGEAYDYEDLGKALKVATGNDFEVKQVTHDEYVSLLESAGLDNQMAAMFASFQAPIDEGSLVPKTDDLVEVLGHKTLSLEDAVREMIK